MTNRKMRLKNARLGKGGRARLEKKSRSGRNDKTCTIFRAST